MRMRAPLCGCGGIAYAPAARIRTQLGWTSDTIVPPNVSEMTDVAATGAAAAAAGATVGGGPSVGAGGRPKTGIELREHERLIGALPSVGASSANRHRSIGSAAAAAAL